MGADRPTGGRRRVASRRVASRRPGARALLVAALLTLGCGTAGVLPLTLIPVAIDDQVRWTTPSVDGPAIRLLFLEEDRGTFPLYRDTVARLGGPDAVRGQPIHKDAWSTTVRVGDRSVALGLPGELWRFLAALGAIVVVALVRHRRRPPDREAADDQSARATSGRPSA